MRAGDAGEPHADRLLTPAFVGLAAADLAYFTAVGVAIYTLPLFVTGPVSGDEGDAGLAYGSFAVSALILRPFAGRLADTGGRRPLLVGGALLAAAGLAATGYVDGLVPLIGLRLLLGVAEAAFFVASFAALADLAPPSRMGEAVSYNSLGLYLGLALGPPLGETVLERSGYTATWWAAAGLAVLAAGVALAIPETRSACAPDTPPTPLIHRPAVAPSLGFFTSLVAVGGFLAFASLHAEDVGLTGTSLPLLVYGTVVVLCRVVFARVPDRLPPLPLGAAALGTIAAGLAVCATWTTPAGLLLGVAVAAVGVGFCTPAFFSAIFATASPDQRGAAAGTASIFLDLGLGVGPILLGLLADAAGIPWALGAAAGVTVAGACWTLVLVGRTGSAVPA
ncbi:MFS transporter [Marmoricola sp. RAF53]|uniref:MFS transporter n=1 Tax=Marmoricola sp. RAF53 TaxID=3233059 RepID=UPI003F9E95DF